MHVIAACWALRAVGCDRIVRLGRRAVAVGCTHCDYKRAVTGRVDLAVGLVSLGLALVTGGSHHNDAGIGEFLDLPANRIVRVGIHSVRAEAKVDHTDVMSSLVLKYPI